MFLTDPCYLNSWKYQHHVLFVSFTGASSDFDGATKIAQMMVTRFGMSDKVKTHYVTHSFFFFMLYSM